MGADCSEKQAELIVSLVKPNGRVWIVPDGDKAGERHAQTLWPHFASPLRAVGENGRWQTADGLVGGTIENKLQNMKRTRPRKGSLFIV